MRLLLKSQPKHIQTHRVGDLIHFNRLMKFGVININNENKISIDLNKIHDVIYNNLKKTIEIQLSKSSAKAKKFIDENTTWNETHQYIADALIKLGIKPYKNIRMFF